MVQKIILLIKNFTKLFIRVMMQKRGESVY